MRTCDTFFLVILTLFLSSEGFADYQTTFSKEDAIILIKKLRPGAIYTQGDSPNLVEEIVESAIVDHGHNSYIRVTGNVVGSLGGPGNHDFVCGRAVQFEEDGPTTPEFMRCKAPLITSRLQYNYSTVLENGKFTPVVNGASLESRAKPSDLSREYISNILKCREQLKLIKCPVDSNRKRIKREGVE